MNRDLTLKQTEHVDRHEGHFNGKYGDELYYQTWNPKFAKDEQAAPLAPANASARGRADVPSTEPTIAPVTGSVIGPVTGPTLPPSKSIVITHGIGEHSECYNELACDFVNNGWQVFGWDLRGHGRSSGKRGFLKSFHDYTDDLERFVDFLLQSQKLTTPFAILGHSMGGLITLEYALDQGPRLTSRAIVLSSPLLGIAVPVPAAKELASKFLLKVAPGLTLSNEIQYEQLTHDLEILKTYTQDSLRHEKICSALYNGMLTTIRHVSDRGSELQKPLLIQAAGHDMIVSLPAIERFFKSVGALNKKMIVYKDDFHEIYNELDRKTVYSDLQVFLKSEFHA